MCFQKKLFGHNEANVNTLEFWDTTGPTVKKPGFFEQSLKKRVFEENQSIQWKPEWNNIREHVCVTITISYEFYVDAIFPLTARIFKDSFCIENKIR